MSISVNEMKFRFQWPTSRQPVSLQEGITADRAIALEVSSGVFGPHSQVPEGQDAVAFYWHLTRPVMRNFCVNAICLLDGVELCYGESQPLRVGSHLQAGHFRLEMSTDDDDALAHQELLPFIGADNTWQATDKIPEVEEILPNGGSYINDLHYFNNVIAQRNSDDVLKMLEIEYKRFLIWQEQGRQYFDNVSNEAAYLIKTDNQFDRVKECLKEKTLTECIVDRTFLMEKVWPDFESSGIAEDIFAEEEKIDLLKSLSPDPIVAKGMNQVPELVFRDFHKIGLDSHY
ncbi:TagK domain-containing protein [Enterobacter cancerogenus]|uniref:TagK domain-containing protein n=1 Tax=Enterobacter cancerogenus TaxID=69218 RepID=UPI00129996E8|nr:TagK domain-containing protein [Enterobacter cancerogenus]QGG11050.1 TagK domain-containing protein [Enterobacter cancerogenus]